jgi:hypothetical protein
VDAYSQLRVYQRAFVDAYIECFENATKAAKKIGYDGPRPDQFGWRMKREIRRTAGDFEAIVGARAQQLLNELGGTLYGIARGVLNSAQADIRDIYDDKGNFKPLREWPDAFVDAVEGIDYDDKGNVVKVRLSNKIEAKKLAVQLFRLTPAQRLELSGKDGAPLAPAAATTVYVISQEEKRAVRSELDQKI